MFSIGLWKNWFQSAPPTEVRGDVDVFREVRRVLRVSIRSPHRSEGRFINRGRRRFFR